MSQKKVILEHADCCTVDLQDNIYFGSAKGITRLPRGKHVVESLLKAGTPFSFKLWSGELRRPTALFSDNQLQFDATTNTISNALNTTSFIDGEGLWIVDDEPKFLLLYCNERLLPVAHLDASFGRDGHALLHSNLDLEVVAILCRPEALFRRGRYLVVCEATDQIRIRLLDLVSWSVSTLHEGRKHIHSMVYYLSLNAHRPQVVTRSDEASFHTRSISFNPVSGLKSYALCSSRLYFAVTRRFGKDEALFCSLCPSTRNFYDGHGRLLRTEARSPTLPISTRLLYLASVDTLVDWSGKQVHLTLDFLQSSRSNDCCALTLGSPTGIAEIIAPLPLFTAAHPSVVVDKLLPSNQDDRDGLVLSPINFPAATNEAEAVENLRKWTFLQRFYLHLMLAPLPDLTVALGDGLLDTVRCWFCAIAGNRYVGLSSARLEVQFIDHILPNLPLDTLCESLIGAWNDDLLKWSKSDIVIRAMISAVHWREGGYDRLTELASKRPTADNVLLVGFSSKSPLVQPGMRVSYNLIPVYPCYQAIGRRHSKLADFSGAPTDPLSNNWELIFLLSSSTESYVWLPRDQSCLMLVWTWLDSNQNPVVLPDWVTLNMLLAILNSVSGGILPSLTEKEAFTLLEHALELKLVDASLRPLEPFGPLWGNCMKIVFPPINNSNRLRHLERYHRLKMTKRTDWVLKSILNSDEPLLLRECLPSLDSQLLNRMRQYQRSHRKPAA